MNNTRTAVFGGSFDPPHLGHLHVADAATEQFGLDAVIWIPACISPFKLTASYSDADDRIAMIECTIRDRPRYSVSDIEIRRRGISYTIDTLRFIRSAQPDSELFLLIGEDAYASFERWSRPDEIRALAGLIVYPRGEQPVRPDASGFSDESGDSDESRYSDAPGFSDESGDSDEPGCSVSFLDGPQIDVASSGIRRSIRNGQPIDGLVPTCVETYIQSNSLYTSATYDSGKSI